MASLFGFELRRKPKPELGAISDPLRDDGALQVAASPSTMAAGFGSGLYVDIDGAVNTETELVSRYRNMVLQPECDMAVKEIINDAIVFDEDQEVVEIVLDDLELYPAVKEAIQEAFGRILDLLEFRLRGWEIFHHFYVDGRVNYQALIDKNNPQIGLQELRYLDPRKIRKIREIARQNPASHAAASANDVQVSKIVKEYYIYSENGFGKTRGGAGGNQAVRGVKIAKDSVINVTSGLTDEAGRLVLSHMHKAIKPLNQLRCVEDACVIYRLTRSPERRVFYIDTGNLPKIRAEQHLRDMMTKFKNRLVYDSATGEVRDERKFMTMYEDFWFARREGGKGTQVDTLQGGQNLGEMEDVDYFLRRLYKSLNVPINRLQPEDTYVLGRSAEITKEEVNFARFIDRLRVRFSSLFKEALEKQLVLTGVCSVDDWQEWQHKIWFRFARDMYFSELKDDEILANRLTTLQLLEPYVGIYYSRAWVKRRILKQDEDDVEKMEEQIEEEAEDPMFNPPIDPMTGEPVQMPGRPLPGVPAPPAGASNVPKSKSPDSGPQTKMTPLMKARGHGPKAAEKSRSTSQRARGNGI